MIFNIVLFFFFNDTATTEIYTLSLHDALPIYRPTMLTSPTSPPGHASTNASHRSGGPRAWPRSPLRQDRKSTRLNSSHANISYAVFCLKKKKKSIQHHQLPQ